MARIRTIKPEFWTHPIMSRQSDSTKLLAIALLNLADDEGYFHAEPNVVRGICRPFDDSSRETKKAIEALQKIGYIEIIKNEDYGHIGWIVNFTTHQKVDKPYPSKLRVYFTGELSKINQRTISDQSTVERKGRERNGKERKGMEETPRRLVDPLDKSFPPGPRVIMTEKELRENMSGQMFIEQSCMALQCDEETFTAHLKQWVDTKVAAGDFLYPINKLKTFCLADFKKQNYAKPKQGQSWDQAQADLDDMIQASKRK